MGVVSHTRSPYGISQGPDGLASRLATEFSRLGVRCTVQVNTENYWNSAVMALSKRVALESQTASLQSEISWQKYLNAARSTSVFSRATKGAILSARQAKLTFTHSMPRSRAKVLSDITAVKRLLNIELSHVDLWQRGIDSKAEWILIVEDDAMSPAIEDCAQGFTYLIQETAAEARPAYVNVSRSFDAQKLGTQGILSSTSYLWQGTVPRRLLRASRPITNTACAVLYRRSFLMQLLEVFNELPMAPVVPIDFKLNEAIKAMYSRGMLGDGDCWQIEPAPIVQMSMHSVR
jgi:hypothetical protein